MKVRLCVAKLLGICALSLCVVGVLGLIGIPALNLADDRTQAVGDVSLRPIKVRRKPVNHKRIQKQVMAVELFLSSRKTASNLPYTPDPRPLAPYSEVVRLSIDTQALAYLNLYVYFRNPAYLSEAVSRLDYILAQGDAALTGTSFDGQIGYSFLVASELTNNESYRLYGLRLADRCIRGNYRELRMNWGYMCAMNAGRAYSLTRDARYLNVTREITATTAQFQFPDGSFPHLAGLVFGKSAGYSSWLTFEMLHHRMDDLDNPDMDPSIIKSLNFLKRRVNLDGTLNYEDEYGMYYSDPGNADGRGWTSDLASIAYNLFAGGFNQEGNRVLDYLFSLARIEKGKPGVGYPDKWGFPDPSTIWASGDPSVARTSLIFWYLTEIMRQAREPSHFVRASRCTVTPSDCHPAYSQAGLCSSGLPGTHTILNGIATKCLNASDIQYLAFACDGYRYCYYSEEQGMSDAEYCTNGFGMRKCVSTECRQTCEFREENVTCVRDSYQGDVCS